MNLYVLPSSTSNPNPSPFDDLCRHRLDGSEYWSARDLQPMAGYSKWQDFQSAIERAMTSAENQGYNSADHFMDVHKKVQIGSGAERDVTDYHLTRFGCYLTFQNGDPRKPEIALAQGYFAMRTREAETNSTAADQAAADAPPSLTGKVRFLREISDLLGLESTRRHAAALAASVLGTPATVLLAESTPTTPSGTATAVATAPVVNALLPAFWDEISTRLVWDLLPFTFLFDLYRAWARRHHPQSVPSSHTQFVHDLLRATSDDPAWYCPGKHQQFRVSTKMSAPEPLIDDYALTHWVRANHKNVYRGLVRRS